MNKRKREYLKRTVAYYQMVDSLTRTALPETDWNHVLRTFGTVPREERIFEKDVTGVTVILPIQDRWVNALRPAEMKDLVTTWHDESVYALIASTDKDHVPNQRMSDGRFKPMEHDDDAVPATSSFVWFLPFGNICGILNEDISALSPTYIASWLTRAMDATGTLPQPNTKLEAVPVIDKDTWGKVKRATKLSSASISGKVRGAEPNALRDLLGGGPHLEGSFDIQIKITPRKVDSRKNWESDTSALSDWFENAFGSLAGITAARARIARTPDQDNLPHDELNLFNHRLTRKRQVAIANPNGDAQAISATSAVTEIIEAYLEDLDEIRKYR